jgi:hypothetical protein
VGFFLVKFPETPKSEMLGFNPFHSYVMSLLIQCSASFNNHLSQSCCFNIDSVLGNCRQVQQSLSFVDVCYLMIYANLLFELMMILKSKFDFFYSLHINTSSFCPRYHPLFSFTWMLKKIILTWVDICLMLHFCLFLKALCRRYLIAYRKGIPMF